MIESGFLVLAVEVVAVVIDFVVDGLSGLLITAWDGEVRICNFLRYLGLMIDRWIIRGVE